MIFAEMTHRLRRFYAQARCWVLGHRWGAWLPSTQVLFRQCYACCKFDQRSQPPEPEAQTGELD